MTRTESTNNSQIIYPSVNAVPLDDDNNNNNTFQSPAMTTAVAFSHNQPSSQDKYATAHVVGSDVSPFSLQLADATETYATATALDPWSNQKTTSTETQERESNQTPTFVYHPPASVTETQERESNQTPTFVYHPPASVTERESRNDVNGTAVLPAAALEDPSRKKHRRRVRRRGRMIVGGAAGFVVGSVILGPLGAIAFGFGAASAAKALSKRGERRKDKRVRRQIEQAVRRL